MPEPTYWVTPGERPGTTEYHCKIDIAHVVGVLDGTPEMLPEEMLKIIQDRLYGLAVNRYEEMWRSIRDARAEVRARSADTAGNDSGGS